MVQVGKLLRTVFLCDYFVNEAFRGELLRVLDRGEAGNALKRAIYVGRVASRGSRMSTVFVNNTKIWPLITEIQLGRQLSPVRRVTPGYNLT